MSQFGSVPLTQGQDLFVSSSTANDTIGSYAETSDGRGFRYAKAGATALVAGKLQQASAQDTGNFQDLQPVAAAIGAKSVTIITAATFTANQVAGGQMLVTVTPGVGYSYRISANSAVTGGSVVLTLEDPLVVALTTTSRVDVVPSPYSEVVVNPTSATSAPVGVAVAATPASNYGWLQVKGVANLLADGAITAGAPVAASASVAGAIVVATSAVTTARIGTALTGIATGEYGPIMLNLS